MRPISGITTEQNRLDNCRPTELVPKRPTALTVSAVIPTKDRPQDLRKAIESLLRQTLLADEIIVVDQSHTSESKDTVLGLSQWQELGIRLNYVHDPAVAGLVAAKELASQRSRSDVVLFLEDDVILEVDFIEKLLLGFEEKPDMMGSCGVIVQMPNANWRYRILFHVFHRGIFRDPRVGVFGIPKSWKRKWVPSIYLSGGLSAYRRIVFERVPFDTKNGFFIMEDVDFSVRAAKAFGPDRFYINTSARLAHTFSPVNRARVMERYSHKVKCYICFYKKNRDLPWVTPSLMWLLTGLFLESLYVGFRIRSVGPVSGWARGLRAGIRWQMLSER